MRSDADVRARYLSLAAQVRRAVDALTDFVEDAKNADDLEPELQGVVESLKTIVGERSVFSMVHRRSFAHYEQIRTVAATLPADDHGQIARKLSAIFDQSRDLADRKNYALDAIEFLAEVENRALHSYNRPLMAGSPRG